MDNHGILFLEKSKLVHNDIYDYSLVDYINSYTKVKIICKKHGIFEQKPNKHKIGFGCNKCATDSKRNNINSLIEKLKIIHNNKYDYSLVNYTNMKTKVKIICHDHGIFEQNMDIHSKGHGCPVCSFDKNKYDTNIFINKSIQVHNNEFDYSLVDYINSYTKVKIICKKHGVFEQKPIMHIFGQKCPLCRYNNMGNDKDIFIEKSKLVHNDIYDYSLVDYINSYTKVKIICKKHGVFEQKPKDHINSKQGCPLCKTSKGENIIIEILKNESVNYIYQKKFENCKNKNFLKFDFYLCDYNTCIEYNGDQHYKPVKYFGGYNTLKYIQKNDNIKKHFCEKNNIKLITINKNDNIDEKINKIIKNNE